MAELILLIQIQFGFWVSWWFLMKHIKENSKSKKNKDNMI